MKKFKILALILIVALIVPTFSGCNLPTFSTTASILDKYDDIFNAHYSASFDETEDGSSTTQYKNLFKKDKTFFITYREGDISHAVSDTESNFYILNYYEEVLNASMSFYYTYKQTLDEAFQLGDVSYSRKSLENMYRALLEVEETLESFASAKTALENLNSIDGGLITGNAFDAYEAEYKDLIVASINFNKAFESAYMDDVFVETGLETSTTITAGGLKRVLLSAEVHLAEIVYNYNIVKLGGFTLDGDNTLLTALTNVNSDIIAVEDDELWELSNLTLTAQEEANLIVYYYLVLQKENEVNIAEAMFITALTALENLEGETDEDSLAYIEDYNSSIELFMQTFNSYALYINDLINHLT